MNAITESLLPVFVVLGLGVLLKRINLVPEEMWGGFERIAYYILFPALLFETVVRADLENAPLTALTLTLFSAVVVLCLIAWATRPLMRGPLGLSGASFSSVYQTATRWNGFIALAIIARLYGDEGLTLVAISLVAMVPVLNVVNVTVVAREAADRQPRAATIARAVARNPFIWSSLGGLAIKFAGIPIPGPLLEAADILGRSALGAGLLLVGAGLVIRDTLRPPPALFVAAALKLLVMPALVAGFAYLFGITGVAFEVAMICAAVPTAMNGYLLARQMGGDAPLYAASVTFQTLLSLATLPLIMALVTG